MVSLNRFNTKTPWSETGPSFVWALTLGVIILENLIASSALAAPKLAAPEAPTELSEVYPTPTPSPTATPSPSYTPTPTPTSEETPTPTSSPHCPLYKANAIYFQGGPGGTAPYFIPTPDTPACLYEEVKKATKTCILKGYGGVALDDCVVGFYFHVSLPGAGFPSSPWIPNVKMGCVDGKCNGAIYYFDENCNIVRNPSLEDISNACNAGLLTALMSPISLIWEANTDIENDVRIVSFPLDPRTSGKFYSWKASDKAPLLVYDPNHTGQITSSFQLFGEWTFGGKERLSMLEQTISDSASPMPWANGFEALASLDSDRNGKVDRAELEPLGLWFDSNRDGVSQAGEVRAVIDLNVTALYYDNILQDKHTRSLSVEVGFERLVEGKRKVGKSVDWYAEQGATPAEVINKQLIAPSICPDSTKVLPEAPREADKSRTDAGSLLGENQINGAWEWRLTRGTSSVLEQLKPSGILVFSDDGSGAIKGHTFGTAKLNQEIVGAANTMRISSLSGTKRVAPSGEVEIDFRVADSDGVELKSSATLSANGNELRGYTTAKITKANRIITYHWIASRSHE